MYFFCLVIAALLIHILRFFSFVELDFCLLFVLVYFNIIINYIDVQLYIRNLASIKNNTPTNKVKFYFNV